MTAETGADVFCRGSVEDGAAVAGRRRGEKQDTVMAELSSRERLLRCLRHEPTDRVPISTYELVGWNRNAWENREPSYRRLMDAIREKTDCIYMLQPEWKSVAVPGMETETWREGKSTFTRTTYHTPKGNLSCLERVDDDLHTRWTLEHLLKDIEDIHRYEAIRYEPPELDMRNFIGEREALGEKGIMMISVDDPICVVAELFEMGQFLVHAISNEGRIKRFLDMIHERQMDCLGKILQYDVRDVVFRVCGPEYATPPYLSPEYFRKYVTGYLEEICRAIKEAGGFARAHCHGRIGNVVDQMAAAGAEGLDPIEPPPDGDIEMGEVKRLYGERLCLFGNLELKELAFASRRRIDALVRKAMEEAKDGGGFVLMPTAAPINVPLSRRTEENYLQYIESGLKYGAY
jgi:hypothetical protein